MTLGKASVRAQRADASDAAPLTAGYLRLGDRGVRFRFDSESLAAYARGCVLLQDARPDRLIGEVSYVADDRVADLSMGPCPANAMRYERRVGESGGVSLAMRLFDHFTVAIDYDGLAATVRYPSSALASYLVDDVLQAALQPMLESEGGFVLHGACVAKDGEATVLTAPSGFGKSTTAFNFYLHGYDLYADDAVLVTPEAGGELWVWPLVREVSLRTLSFSLLGKGRRIDIPYRTDNGKYLVPLRPPAAAGALLRRLCFLEIGGETATALTALSRADTLAILRGEDRHFPYLLRPHREPYAIQLSERVPVLQSVRLGRDLDAQVLAIEGRAAEPGAAPPAAAARDAGRQAKLALIRQAWQSPGREPLRELLPLIGDTDVTVLQAAVGFLNHYALAQLPPLESTAGAGDELERACASNRLPWLRARDWAEGCRELCRSVAPEVIAQFGEAWLRGAPTLLPFLRAAALDGGEREAIDRAWQRCRDGAVDTSRTNHAVVWFDAWPDGAMSPAGARAADMPGREPPAVFLGISRRDPAAWDDHLAAWPDDATLTIVPVVGCEEGALDAAVECVRHAAQRGRRTRLSRALPLCALRDDDALFLLEGRLLGDDGDIDPLRHPFALAAGGAVRWTPCECRAEAGTRGMLGFCSGGGFALAIPPVGTR